MNVNNVKTGPYKSNDILRYYHYSSDPKLGPWVVDIKIFPWSYHDCTTQLSLPWDSKIKGACNQPRYGRVYDLN